MITLKRLIEDPIEIFLKEGLVKSRNEGRRLLAQGGLHVGECTLSSDTKLFGCIVSGPTQLMLRRGKKHRCIIDVDFTDTWVVPI